MFQYLWGAWLFAFVLIEGAALVHRAPGDTFSEFTWAFLNGGWSRFMLVGGLLLWLIVHFLGKGRWG